MPRPSSRLPLLFLLLAPGAVAAQPATGASAPVPGLFAPLPVERPFGEEERLLRELGEKAEEEPPELVATSRRPRPTPRRGCKSACGP